MRISTATSYLTGTYDMQSLQSQLQSLQSQLDTQKRVVTPADDPVAAARILQLNQSDGMNSQYITNTKAVESTLSLAESQLSNASNLLTSLKAVAIQAGNTVLSSDQLLMIQKQVQEGISEMTGYANATDGKGNYLFSGNKVDTPPYVLDATYTASYKGDTGQRNVPISASRSMQISDAGSNIFGNASSPTAVFDALKSLNDLLAQNPKPSTYSTDMGNIVSALDAAQKNLATNIASIGARRQENQSVQDMGTQLGLQYKSGISDLQDLDMPSAITSFTQTQTSLKYSQLVYNKVTSLSLFNYMS
ncbi:flagellar hook-associated protein FlgL [Aquitalea magnusonii]|jgi:flagellar hook-associated protein 3 FlgL|uniref:Flagellar hook-associated protein FlgL n=1 Tax=Aquitalea magnusonii TaxID=332411 RepID=A0A3G9GF94_9NEIS|nr:flagellar hook-associated protein FlgL [Aquitalea magnusonii]BBF86044.1 flagellar hook-associated protein FlgL [Aquitalea magnusonii]